MHMIKPYIYVSLFLFFDKLNLVYQHYEKRIIEFGLCRTNGNKKKKTRSIKFQTKHIQG